VLRELGGWPMAMRGSTPAAAPSPSGIPWALRGPMATTANKQLHRIQGRYALCTVCIGVGQGIAVVLERV
jgi:Thiolase, C-terminal domain